MFSESVLLCEMNDMEYFSNHMLFRTPAINVEKQHLYSPDALFLTCQ